MKTRTVKELHEYLDGLVQIGKGDLPVLFDTEAKTFNYHMAQVGDAYYEEQPYEHVQLHEKR